MAQDPMINQEKRLNKEDVDRLKAYLGSLVAREVEKNPPDPARFPQAIRQILENLYQSLNLGLPEPVHQRLVQEVLDEQVGYGPIQPLLADNDIVEILIDGPKRVYVERGNELHDTGIQFQDADHLMRIINRIVLPLGRRVDADNPTADARLPDGSRVNVVLPPISLEGPCVTIRKFPKNRLTIEQLIELGALTGSMAEFLKACILARLNILISGNTSSGKTTMLNILSGFIPYNERIISIEDAAELQLSQKYVVRLETKMPDTDGKGEVTARDLVRNALRMRPDRIIVGEVRGGETLDMLQAMNTGHSGSLTTCHANSPRDATARLETMTLMTGIDLPIKAIRRQMASAIQLVIHLSRLQDGSRRVTNITEITGMETDVITMQDIFKFEQTGISSDGKIIGELKSTGLRPMFTPRLEVAGFKLKGEIFGLGRATSG